MATQTVTHRPRTSNTPTTHRNEALLIAQERLATLQASARPVTEIHFTSDPGPDFTPRAWR
ncbi:MAG: hypothetical protein FWG59_06565 [Betaproteobacteria bacterium]|nr:hypothetical protein [Betaproteobacteria bacterium]